MQLEFQQSSLMREVRAIMAAPNPVHFNWSIRIHVGKLTYEPLKLLSIDFTQDYESKYADEIILTAMIPAGMYGIDIYPFKDQLEITLMRKPIFEVDTSNNAEVYIETERYSATLIDIGNPVISGNSKFTPTRESLNLSGILEVSFQLVNKAVEQLRLITVGGIYRNVLAGDVIKAIMTNETKKIKVDGARLPIGVDMVPGYNDKLRDHVLIPQGTRLVDLPDYVHRNCGGIYPTGLGYYIQNDHWYIYPCYDTVRIAKATNVLTIINVPPHMFPSIERTYRKDGKSIVILATGDVRFEDNSEARQLNDGNGVRFSDANKFMSDFGVTVENKTSVSRGGNNTEIVATNRTNSINNVPMSALPINANPFLEYSKLAVRSGGTISLVWENSLPSLIVPGAMVRIMYLTDTGIKTIEGIILKCHHFVAMKEKGLAGSRYVTRSALFIFCKNINAQL